MKQIKIPSEVKKVINIFNEKGFKAYLTGGCVRDLIMGKSPNDYDISTSALPQQVKGLFDKTYDTGIKHGTVTVIYNGAQYEITTFRIEDKYTDKRRPDKVRFTKSVKEDIKRRDFTINAMAADCKGNLIDLYEGMEHIKKQIIKCVGDPDKRFSEDALRMLRAIRFSCQLDFEVEKDTKNSIKKLSYLINNISYERIKSEMDKIILSDNPKKGVLLLSYTGILKEIMPELNDIISDSYNNAEYITNNIENIDKDLNLRWTLLLCIIGKNEECKNILRRYKFDNKSKSNILKLLEYIDVKIINDDRTIKKIAGKIGTDLFLDLLKVKKCLTQSQELDSIRKRFSIMTENKECMSINCLNISGKDLINLGFREGEGIGKILQELLNMVIDYPHKNKKEILKKKALEIKRLEDEKI